jgi:hypothetical protein
MKRAAPTLLLLFACVLLSACSTLTSLAYSNVGLAYRNLPPMLAWMVDDYVEMHGGQKDWVRDRIARVMQWHRSHELPEYRRFLERVLAETYEPFTVQEVGDAYRELRVHYRRTVEQVLPDVADFLLQLDAEQAKQMERKFEEDNRKFVKESVRGTPAERRERRVKRFIDHLENWTGDLSDAQRELIQRHYRDIHDDAEERLGDRKYRHGETLALIRAKPPREQMIASLRRLLVDTDSWRRPEYVQKVRERDQRFFVMFSELSATLSAEQRTHLQKRIRTFMSDLNKLS